MGGWVYFMSNRPSGTLYVGVTADLSRRVWEHKNGLVRFSHRYNLHRLVYAEAHDDIRVAIQRETSIKRWPRQWKINLIMSVNPEWRDLSSELQRERSVG
jgi:putative endonuclease